MAQACARPTPNETQQMKAVRFTFLLLVAIALVSTVPAAASAKKPRPKAHATKADRDGDGIRNKRDRDIDGDRKPNGRDRNVDGDRKPNRRDREVDSDGKPNGRDRDIDSDRIPNGRDRDVDADGVLNRRDRNIDSDAKRNPRDRDMDGDGIPNHLDPDMDGDGIPNKRDMDMDGDGVPNSKDLDVDGNGIPNADDPDTDGDGIADADDRDMDGDGVPNGQDSDTDGDGIPDFLDPDIDGDGIPNYEDDDSDGTGDDVTRLPEEVSVRVPPDFFGLVADEIFWASGSERPAVMAKAQSTGIGTVRQLFDWSIVERAPGVYDWSAYDRYVADMTRAGLTILPILYHPPGFHSGRPPGDTTHGTYPPATNASLAAYAIQAVRRYGPAGSFWAERPELPQRPLRSWQIWNEPNLRVYWLPKPNAAQYTQMLKTVGAAIRLVDPGAEILTAGLPHSRAGVSIEQFVRDMYAAGAKGSFDTLAIHPYAGGADGVYSLVNLFRALLDEHGDTDKRIWITELGWATGGPAHPFNIGEHGQAELTKRVLATLVAQAPQLKLRGLIYFNWRDLPPDPATGDRWGLHAGLFRRDGSEKPGFTAFHDALALLKG
jgi:hypothetical protein